jgi:leader peptidase (prepilin peptidase)/N-methyltransferase
MMLLILAFIIGTMVGSFLNVCAYRIPEGQSIVLPASHCRACKKPIAFYDNIPLVSFLLLRGKCRHCGAPLSFQYPLVEFLTGLLAAACLLKWGAGYTAALWFAFCAALVVVTFIDLAHQIIPDVISLPGIVCGLLCSLLPDQPGFTSSLIGAAVGGGSLYLIRRVYYAVARQEGMGLGDVKLLAMIGAFLGWKSILFIIMVASFAGALLGIAVMIIKRKDGRYAIPFGPFLSLGAVCYLFCGQEMINWYRNLHLLIREGIG